MYRVYLAARPSVRQSNSFFLRFLICYAVGTLLGLLAVRISQEALGSSLEMLGRSVSFADRNAWLSRLRSSGLSFLLIILLSQLSGRAFWLSAFFCGKAFCTAYVAGVLYSTGNGAGLPQPYVQWVVHAALLLPALYGLSWHCQNVRLFVGSTHGLGRKLLPILLALAYLPLALGLEAVLFAQL